MHALHGVGAAPPGSMGLPSAIRVSTGTDAFEMILCGAKAVQVGTCHWTEGAPCFERITRELKSIMQNMSESLSTMI